MTSGPLRVVLADDQSMVRAGFTLILRSEPDISVVAECSNGNEAVIAARRHAPDVVLMDVRMPGMDGLEATRRIRSEPDAPPILILTTFEDDDVLWGAINAGAAGFVLKDSEAEALVAAVRMIAAGGAWLDPRVTPRVLANVRGRRPRAEGATAQLSQLTPRELEVFRLIAAGATNGEIADQLRLGERTVKSHVSAVFAKLHARDRAAAVILAYELGVVDQSPG